VHEPNRLEHLSLLSFILGLVVLLLGLSCKTDRAGLLAKKDLSSDEIFELKRAQDRQSELPPREEGPPRAETGELLTGAATEAERLADALLGGGIPPREAASVADMRGYRLYRRRLFGQALAWFSRAVKTDPSFEPSLYNAARCAALLGEVQKARAYLQQLRGLRTPLAHARLQRAPTDPDLASAY
jgi:hypothetical protein